MNYGIGNVKSGGVSNTMLTTTTDAAENSGTYTLDLTYLSETPKVNDYVVYVNSGNLTTLYQVSAVGSTEATLTKLGDIGGGKQLYQHNITAIYITSSPVYIYASFQIITDSNTAFTYSTLRAYLYDNGFTSDIKLLSASGTHADSSNSKYIYGVYGTASEIKVTSVRCTTTPNKTNTTIAEADTSLYDNIVAL